MEHAAARIAMLSSFANDHHTLRKVGYLKGLRDTPLPRTSMQQKSRPIAVHRPALSMSMQTSVTHRLAILCPAMHVTVGCYSSTLATEAGLNA